MENSLVELDKNHGIATLTINRAEKKNALTQAMWAEIPTLIEAVNQDKSIRVLVVCGAGTKDFSAGADIIEFLDVRKDKTTAEIYEAHNVSAFNAIKHCQKPTIAMIRGICFGGGFGLAAACDLRIAAKDALFAIPAAKLGLAYPLATLSHIVDALGEQNTKAMIYSGNTASSKAMYKQGFLLARTSNKDLVDFTKDLAENIAQNAPLTLCATKVGIAAINDRTDAAWQNAKTLSDKTFDSADYQEGIKAFKEKRKAKFSGS